MSRSTPSTTRPRPPDDVFFPVVPMLDMAFQLLAFFILTFQAPSNESVLNLRMPIGPAALPGSTTDGITLSRSSSDAVSLLLRAEATPDGNLDRIRLQDQEFRQLDTLPARLKAASDGGTKPVRLTLEADDALKYDVVALLLSLLRQTKLETLRLAVPSTER